MTAGELRTALEGVPDDRQVCALAMRPGTFFVEIALRDVNPDMRSSQPPFGEAPPIVGLRLGDTLNSESLGGY